MNKSSIYLETTILSYLAARPSRDIIIQAHQQITWDWWESQKDNYDLYISEMVIQEIMDGDSEAVKKRQLFAENIPVLKISAGIRDLASDLIKFLRLPQRAEPDAIHLAFAINYEINFLLTWNCAHLANGLVINKLKNFEIKTASSIPVIVTPEELLSGGEDYAMD
jgi:predicted nucleic acid-binding protein